MKLKKANEVSDVLSGKYVTLSREICKGLTGGLLEIKNPVSRMNTVPLQALKEIHSVLDKIESEEKFSFVVLFGTFAKIHAGADLTLFAGEIDPERVHGYLWAGTELNLRIKKMARKVRTVSVIQGERYGGSVEWPLMAEFSVCTAEAGIQFSEVNVGLIPGWNGILNVLLRSSKENALYMAATGNRVSAGEMLETGLVSAVAPEDSVLEKALEIAVGPQATVGMDVKSLADRNEIEQIVARRTEPQRYRELVGVASGKLTKGELSAQKGENYIGKFIEERLKELGRPIAPLAAQAVFKLIDRFPEVSWNNFEVLKEMAYCEAELCFQLMNTLDRRVGVDSILASNPLEKIPIFSGK